MSMLSKRHPVDLLARGLAVNRILFGTGLVLAPRRAGRSWIGGAARSGPATPVFGPALGARDLALGAGALIALRAGDDRAARGWMAGQALADGVDLVATALQRERIPAGPLAYALTMAAGSLAIAVAAVKRLS